jgi:transposase-like protein
MQTKELNACNTNICSLQLKVFDFGGEKIDFDEKLNNEFNPLIMEDDINNKIHMVNKNHFELLNPICPKCGEHKVIKEEYILANKKFKNRGKEKIYLRRYKCKKCKSKFQTKLKEFFEPGTSISTKIKDDIRNIAKKGYKSLRSLSREIEILTNLKISHQTISNVLDRNNTKNEIRNKIPKYSGYYSYDEQFVEIKGEKRFRMTLFDNLFNIPVAEKITTNRKNKKIIRFIKENTKNQPKISIVTDHFKAYHKIMTEIGFKHQLCIFHLFQMVNKKLIKALKSKKLSTCDKMQTCLYMTEYREIFRTYDKKTAQKRLENMIMKSENLPDFLSESITKKVLKDFDMLTEFMKNNLIEKTSNHTERYYSRTLNKTDKKRFKTAKGLLNYLYSRMEDVTEIFMKKFHYPKLPKPQKN